jgi:hypothetical protein
MVALQTEVYQSHSIKKTSFVKVASKAKKIKTKQSRQRASAIF